MASVLTVAARQFWFPTGRQTDRQTDRRANRPNAKLSSAIWNPCEAPISLDIFNFRTDFHSPAREAGRQAGDIAELTGRYIRDSFIRAGERQ